MKKCLKHALFSSAVITCCFFVFVWTCQAKDSKAGQPSAAEWTILIFMNGDNNLEPDALINFRQLAAVGSTDAVNVIVQFDRIAKYARTTPNWSQTLRFRITKGMEPVPANALEDIGEANMGDGAVLSDFVKWGKERFPAKRYMLIIWDHGQGWRLFTANLIERQRNIIRSRALPVQDSVASLRAASVLLRSSNGVASAQGQTAAFRSAPGAPFRSASNDETNQDVLYNREISDALKAVFDAQKLEILGFDACLMSMIETAYAFRNVAHFLVASEELEPGLGWRYDDWLAKLIDNPTQDARALAKMTVETYQATYTNPRNNDPATTLAAIDLSNLNDLGSAVSSLSSLLIARMDTELRAIIEARAAISTYAPGYAFYHVDLAQFLKELASRTKDPDIQSHARTVTSLISASVIANYAGLERLGTYGSNGIAVYFPRSKSEYVGDPFSEGGYEKDNHYYPVEFVEREKWADLLHEYWNRVP
jgi:hypothetical protein